MNEHHWSGWPGAYCLHCGLSDPVEQGLADGTYDPISNSWTSKEAREGAMRANGCPLAFDKSCGQCVVERENERS